MNRQDEALANAQERDAKILTSRMGEPLRIHLWEDRTRGELWIPSYNPEALVLVGDDFLRIMSGNAVDAGRRTFEFKPVAPGTHRVVFEKRMGWKFTAEDRRVFLVQVSPGGDCLAGG